MIPVFQKIIDPGRGDCWRACICSILELPIDSVPNFVGEAHDNPRANHLQLASNWLKDRGLCMIDVNLKGDREWFYVLDWTLIKGAYAIGTVPSQKNKGGWHAVVIHWTEKGSGVCLEIVHDPREDNQPYPEDTKFRRIQFIAPLIPKIA